jgi:segregation and condensation protein A
MFAVSVEKFEGPLDLLLNLIETEKLDICQISLSKITDAYIDHVEEMHGSAEEMADFLVVAAKLLYLKSKELLPGIANEEDEKELAELEQNLIEYARYKKAAEELSEILSKNYRSFSRKAKTEVASEFLPPKDISKDKLWNLFQEALKRMEQSEPAEYEEQPVKITLEDKKIELKTCLKKGRVSFRQIMRKAKSKVEVIVTFLAVLELIKKKEIKVHQESNFEDLTIETI